MAEAPFMFHEYEQQLAQLYLNYEQAVFANPCDREQVRVTFETWRALLFYPKLGHEVAASGN